MRIPKYSKQRFDIHPWDTGYKFNGRRKFIKSKKKESSSSDMETGSRAS